MTRGAPWCDAEWAGPQGRPEIANTSSETCSCRDQSAKTQGGAGVLRRNESNRAEKYHKAKHRQGISRATWVESWSRCKSVQVMQGNGVGRPARPVCDKPVSARTRWNLFGDRGVVQGGDRVPPGAVAAPAPAMPAACGRPAPLTRGGLRAVVRVLPLGDPVHRSPTGQYPTPAGEDWVLDARARVRGPLTGPLAFHMLTLPARPARTADSVLRPQRGGRAHCARRVDTPPAIGHSVPAWQCPAESGRGPPRPGEPALSQRTGVMCPPGSAQQVPAGRPPPARQHVVSQRSSTLCPPGSDQSSGLADHRQPAKGQAPGDQARVPARE
jgi:hypothetical protein